MNPDVNTHHAQQPVLKLTDLVICCQGCVTK